MYCAIGPGRQSDPDICASNGLCLDPGGTWWREGCTDQSWSDPACIKLYINGTFYCLQSEFVVSPPIHGSDPDAELDSGNDIPMTMCPDGSYCAGTRGAATQCCDYHQRYSILANLTVTQQNPNTTASASTSMASSTSSMAVTVSSSSSSSGLTTGTKGGSASELL
jgi:hypothetical protein